MKFSVIIVTFNCADRMRACLESLQLYAKDDHEIIIVDNDSDSETKNLIREASVKKVLLNSENRGFSKACNQGAVLAEGDFVVFLNPDTLVTPDWTKRMSAYFRYPYVAAVGPTSNGVAGLQKFEYYVDWQAVHYASQSRQSQSDTISSVLGKRTDAGIDTKLLIGFCIMMRRCQFEAVGGMDERLFLGNDDLDLSWRLRRDGKRLVVASDVFIYHEGQASFKTNPNKDHFIQESTDRLYEKLVAYYGGRDKVPTSEQLWGMSWFSPSEAVKNGRAF